jgi:hypothetical protein
MSLHENQCQRSSFSTLAYFSHNKPPHQVYSVRIYWKPKQPLLCFGPNVGIDHTKFNQIAYILVEANM